MADEKSHPSSTPKDDLLQVGTTSPHSREKSNPTNNVTADIGAAAVPSVLTLVDIYDSDTIDPVYRAKSHAISCAIQEIGIGRYQVWIPFGQDLEVLH
jgi:hypothetical protein